MKNLILMFVLAFSTPSFSKSYEGLELEDNRKINGVSLYTGKVDDLRTYLAETSADIDAPFKTVMAWITKFESRCNNDYKDKRKYMSQDYECPLHNANLVESFPIRDFKAGYKKEKNETDRFLLRRNIYNRESFGYYDLVVVRQWKENGKRVAEVTYRMLTNFEAKRYLDRPEPLNSAFTHIAGKYLVSELDKNKVKIDLTYASKTDHWMLNKGMAVGLLYKNIAKGTRSTLENISRASTENL